MHFTPGGCTTEISGMGTCHPEGYLFSRYWYKERYQFSQFWGIEFQDFGMKYKVGYTFSRNLYKVGYTFQLVQGTCISLKPRWHVPTESGQVHSPGQTTHK